MLFSLIVHFGTEAIEPMNDLVKRALEFGFSHAGMLDASTLKVRHEVRDMCSADKCKMYDRTWMCPPACGSIEDNQKIIESYQTGLIVQTTGELEDDFDIETMEEAGADQKVKFQAFARELRNQFPNMLPLTSGACTLCETCTYPDSPCKNPIEASPSMEAFGLVVSDVCTANGVSYYYGPRTITYTGCYLFQSQEV